MSDPNLLLLLLVLFEILLVILLFLSDGLLVRRERDTPLCSLSGSRDPGVRSTHAQVGATLRARLRTATFQQLPLAEGFADTIARKPPSPSCGCLCVVKLGRGLGRRHAPMILSVVPDPDRFIVRQAEVNA